MATVAEILQRSDFLAPDERLQALEDRLTTCPKEAVELIHVESILHVAARNPNNQLEIFQALVRCLETEDADVLARTVKYHAKDQETLLHIALSNRLKVSKQ